MKTRLTIGLVASIFVQDPARAGFAPDAYLSPLLALIGLVGLSLLTLWSEQLRHKRTTSNVTATRLELLSESNPASLLSPVTSP